MPVGTRLYIGAMCSFALYQLDQMGVTPGDVLRMAQNKTVKAANALSTDPVGALSRAYNVAYENRALQMILLWLIFKGLAYYFKLRVQARQAKEEAEAAAAAAGPAAAAPTAAGKASKGGKSGSSKKKN